MVRFDDLGRDISYCYVEMFINIAIFLHVKVQNHLFISSIEVISKISQKHIFVLVLRVCMKELLHISSDVCKAKKGV